MGAHLAPSVSSPCVLQVSEKQSWTTVDFITLTCGYSVCLFVKADCLRSLVVQSLCLTLWQPMDCSTPGFAVLHYLLEFAQIHVHWVSEAFCLILCLPLLLLPSIFPSIRVFSKDSALHIRWPKCIGRLFVSQQLIIKKVTNKKSFQLSPNFVWSRIR